MSLNSLDEREAKEFKSNKFYMKYGKLINERKECGLISRGELIILCGEYYCMWRISLLY